MAGIIQNIALFLILIATGGFIVYLIKQQKEIFQWSYIILFIAFAFHTFALIHQYFLWGAAPVISLKSTLSFFSWCIIGAYLVFQIRFKLMILGSFIAPLAAVLMIISSAIPKVDLAVRTVLKSTWLSVHVGTIFIGDAIFAIAFMAAIMYLIQERQIKKKTHGSFYRRLPSLETLDSINHYSLIYGFPFLTIGMITGAIYAQFALGSYWRWDPKEIWSLITWLSYAVLLHERLAVGWRGRRAALMSIVCFMILIFTFVGGSMWLSDYHSFKTLGGRAGL
jgi:cytochrome c-type biogenesis protein CcsB